MKMSIGNHLLSLVNHLVNCFCETCHFVCYIRNTFSIFLYLNVHTVKEIFYIRYDSILNSESNIKNGTSNMKIGNIATYKMKYMEQY